MPNDGTLTRGRAEEMEWMGTIYETTEERAREGEAREAMEKAKEPMHCGLEHTRIKT